MDTGYNMLSTTTLSTLLIPSGTKPLCPVVGFGSKPPPPLFEPKLLDEFSPARADARSPEDANAAAARRFAI